jgi:hypothetical protein
LLDGQAGRAETRADIGPEITRIRVLRHVAPRP